MFHQFPWLFQAWKMHWFFLCIFHEKWAPKWSQNRWPKSYSNNFGRPKGRPGPIVNVCGSEKNGKRVILKSMKKMVWNLEASEWQKMAESIPPWSPKGWFWSRRAGKEGTSPSGSGDFGFDSVFSLKRPAPGGVRRMFFGQKTCLGHHWIDLSGSFWRFVTVRRAIFFF